MRLSYPSCGATANRHTPRSRLPTARAAATGASAGSATASPIRFTSRRKQHHPVQRRAHQPQRRPVRPGQRDQRPGLPVRCHRDIGIQHRQARPPPQRQDGRLPPRHQLTDTHLDQTRYSRSRTHPCQPLIQLPERLAAASRCSTARARPRPPAASGGRYDPASAISVPDSPYGAIVISASSTGTQAPARPGRLRDRNARTAACRPRHRTLTDSAPRPDAMTPGGRTHPCQPLIQLTRTPGRMHPPASRARARRHHASRPGAGRQSAGPGHRRTSPDDTLYSISGATPTPDHRHGPHGLVRVVPP